ncbi:DUF262 domain-containing protein [[Mycoplasma] mobile]|uniref:GmrSD restriction endonucleases N-terminal domain-containing protein n=1 Tax=Mycoplasma mobile (strain ATCC 43663 / 163K / NCTC 11711) TaxID=267748 RepID=Q6KH33_MYCM1|nr:DUF262 domain-containing protein [[Mycoplasma] mobile]AAT28098.1 conserved hypothetical protein [Mycoplasma mobile 163K]
MNNFNNEDDDEKLNENFVPKSQGLKDFLEQKKNFQFVIPIYQRNYNWEISKQVKKFMESFEHLFKEKNEEHFLGTLILILGKKEEIQELFVIDGQQRLTTTFLAFFAIRNLLNENANVEKSLLKKIKEELNKIFFSNKKNLLKIHPAVERDKVFEKITRNSKKEDFNSDEKTTNIFKAYEYFKKELKGYIKNNEEELMKILRTFNRMIVVSIEVRKNVNQQKLFESINSTGVKLTNFDLIKNFLLMKLETRKEQDQIYNEYWKILEKNVTISSEKNQRKYKLNLKTDEIELEHKFKGNDFFKYFLSIKEHKHYSEEKFYNSFKKWFENKGEDFNIKNAFDELKNYSNLFNQIFKKSKNPKIEEELIEYRKMNIYAASPLIIEMLKWHDDKEISANLFNDMLKVINTYLVRNDICNNGDRLKNISQTFLKILEELENVKKI